MANFSKLFSEIRVPKPKRNVFDLSYVHYDTCNFGDLVPVYYEHTVPGDKFRISCSPFVRMDTLSAPTLSEYDVTVHYFWTPYRLLWNKFEDFITGGRLGVFSEKPPVFMADTLEFNLSSENSYAEFTQNYRLYESLRYASHFLGSTGTTAFINNGELTRFKFLAYWKIWDEYYRDQNLEPSLFNPDTGTVLDFLDPDSNLATRLIDEREIGGIIYKFGRFAKRAWTKDPFTAALPFSQRGGAVTISPLGDGPGLVYTTQNGVYDIRGASDTATALNALSLRASHSLAAEGNESGTVTVDTNTVAVTIEDLREANAVQRFLERMAISGSRYKEFLLGMYGVDIQDYRIDRPLYIGGVKTPISISQVVQQSQTTDDSALGDLGGYGVSAGRMIPASVYTPEFGVILGILSITPRAIYSQGFDRNDHKFDRYDYFNPLFENLGEQEVLSGELYVTGLPDMDDSSFGYSPRYYEYKYRSDFASGEFTRSLSYWLSQRRFTSPPHLNGSFVKIDTTQEASLNNVFAVTDSSIEQFKVAVANNVRVIRPMQVYSNFNF